MEDTKAEFGGTHDPAMGVILGLPFHRVTMAEALAACEQVIARRLPEYMVTANLDFTRLASEDPWLRGFLFHAHRVFCDGLPLVWLSGIFGGKLPERVAGSDLVPRLLNLSAEKGYRVYFLGSDDATLREVCAKLSRDMPELEVAGWHAPPFGPIESWDNERVVRELRESRADIVLVAVGCPKQERWIAAFHRESGVPLSIGVGASLDFLVGKQIRAPGWLQRIGLEWFWRMARSPRRLAGRYAKDVFFLIRAGRAQGWAMRSRGQVAKDRYVPGGGEVVIRFGDGFPDQRMLPSEVATVVCDCAEIVRFRGGELGALAAYSRAAKRRGVAFRIVNPPRALSRAVKAFQLEGELPLFENAPRGAYLPGREKSISTSPAEAHPQAIAPHLR